MVQTNMLMIDFLKSKNYDIESSSENLSVVKHSDDPWNHFNKFIAKADGVYNFIENTMGVYREIKRVSCESLEAASFLTLALFVSRENVAESENSLIEEIKKLAGDVISTSVDHHKGQFIIDNVISFSN